MIKKVKKILFVMLAVIVGGFILLIIATMLFQKHNDVQKHAHRSPLPGTDIYEYSWDEYLQYQIDHPELFQTDDVIEYEVDTSTLHDEEEGGQNNADDEDVDALFLKMLEPADDEWDYHYAQDVEISDTLGFVYARDANAYRFVFGNEKPTLDELYKSIDSNSGISAKYNKFLKDYVKNWLTLWPESDLSIFNYNVKSLKIETLTAEEIQRKTMSAGTAACYLNQENTICINENCDFENKSSNDYVVFIHEITHAARNCRSKVGERQFSARFYVDGDAGLYEDEALATWFAYQIQGMDHKAIYYTLQSSIYRQILPYMDYDGADYMNHSFSYFMEKLQEYFDEVGIACPAYHFTNLVDCKAIDHYKKYQEPVIKEFEQLYEVLAVNYAKNHLNDAMSLEETEQQFEEFWKDITFNFENLSSPYPEITKECFKPYWDGYVSDLGI